jgi:co-chaperonin GroES (HSP10)
MASAVFDTHLNKYKVVDITPTKKRDIVAVGKNVVCKVVEKKSAIINPNGPKGENATIEVISIGSDVCNIKVGDKIAWSKGGDPTLKIENGVHEYYVILHEENIQAVFVEVE